MPTIQHVLQFPATLDGLAQGAGALRDLLNVQQVDVTRRNNIEVVFEEVVANIVRHGAPRSDVGVAIAFGDDEIVMTFEDDGVPFDPRERPDPVAPTSIDDATVGGLGLVLLRKLTRMAYERTPEERNLLTLAIPAR